MLFSSFERTDASPKKNSETSFAFLNRSARPEIARVRDFVVDCLSSYPQNDRQELVARISSGNDVHFSSATFELLLHALLTRLRFELEAHPELSNGSTARPDFLVKAPNGEEFYLEAVLASENTDQNKAAGKMKGVALDVLSATPHKNFLVTLIDAGEPETQPSGTQLAKAASNWLDTLDPDHVAASINDGREPPTLDWIHEAWKLTIKAFPLKPERRGTAKVLIGGWIGPAGWVDGCTPIRNAVRHKGAKYGHLGKPLVVAVDFNSFTLNRIDEMQALYGQEQFVDSSEHGWTMMRVPNGAWYGNSGPQGRRCSAMWSFNDLNPYTAAVRSHTVYLNPWAHHQGPTSLEIFPHAKASQVDQITWVDGMALREAFGLPDGWPE